MCVIALFSSNILLLHQNETLTERTKKEIEGCKLYEETIGNNIKNIGTSICKDSITSICNFYLRFNQATCLTCLYEAEALLANVFGEDWLCKKLCLVGTENMTIPLSKTYSSTSFPDFFSNLDTIYTPYLCVTNKAREILFVLTLKPENYSYNKKLLLKLKDSIKRNEENY